MPSFKSTPATFVGVNNITVKFLCEDEGYLNGTRFSIDWPVMILRPKNDQEKIFNTKIKLLIQQLKSLKPNDRVVLEWKVVDDKSTWPEKMFPARLVGLLEIKEET